jgi:hypothetical protein
MEIKRRRRRKVKVRGWQQPMVDRRREKQVDARPTQTVARG